MATLHILNRLRRSVPKVSRQFHFLSNRNPNPNSTAALSSLLRHFPRLDCPGMASANVAPLAGARGSLGARSIFTRSDDDSVFSDSGGFDFGSVAELAAESKVLDSGPAGGEESILPVRAVISMLDGFHDLTGLPWWIVLACSTLVLRATLFPLFIIQLHKLKKIGELYHKLPPSLPPLFSGKSYVDHISLFREKRKAIGCPSYLWYLAYFSVQVPCFLLLLTTIRRMSLDHHPGFDCGGALWFLNLTEFSHGALGSIFPVAVAGLHYANVQISFQTLSASKGSGIFNIKYFKIFMDLLTLPILLTCYYVPQGSLVYWVTNSSLTFIQKLSLKNPSVRVTLGLPSSDDSSAVGSSSIDTSTVTPSSKSENHKISVEDLTPKELTSLSVQLLSRQQLEKAIHILQLALAKDPEYIKALILMGQAQLQKGMLAEAIENLERAVSKLMLSGYPTEEQAIDHLIVSSLWAGSAYTRQGKPKEGLVHLERIGELKEPEDPKIKAHYFDGLLMLSSALYGAGRREEAAKHLRLLVTYNPAYSEFLEQCEKDDDNELARGVRRDF